MSTTPAQQNRQRLTLSSVDDRTARDLTAGDAATRLGLSYDQFTKKLLDAGLITPRRRYSLADITPLADRPTLVVTDGETSVLRTRGKHESRTDSDDRPTIGVHTDYTNGYLDSTCLKWWRADPTRICDNGLMIVTTGERPFAVYAIDGLLESYGSGTNRRHWFDGRLLIRCKNTNILEAGDQIVDELTIWCTDTFRIVTTPAGREDRDLLGKLTEIMQTRVNSTSGGPIAYLPDDAE